MTDFRKNKLYFLKIDIFKNLFCSIFVIDYYVTNKRVKKR